MLLVGAGLLVRSFERLQSVPPGFKPANLLVADLPLSQPAHPRPAERMDFLDRVLDRARSLPGVESAGGAVSLPVSGGGSMIHFNIQGRAPKSPHDYILVGYRPVSPTYLDTLGVPLVKGRLLARSDTETRPFAAVVNRAMERRFFPGESAIGKRVQLGTEPDNQEPQFEIVGVVGDMKQNLATDPQAEMYVPYRQANAVLPVYTLSLVLRTAADPRSTISNLRKTVREIDPNQPLVKIRTMEENISASISAPRFRTVLLAIFAGSALLLAAIGLYGLMAYSVTQRVQEIGIRVTLGAQRGDVIRMILRQGLALVAIGIAAGLAGSFVLSRVLEKFLYGVTAVDPLTYALVAAVLTVAALIACYVPARRATKVDPMVALRYE
jgi:putative ABC transport system permease protein